MKKRKIYDKISYNGRVISGIILGKYPTKSHLKLDPLYAVNKATGEYITELTTINDGVVYIPISKLPEEFVVVRGKGTTMRTKTFKIIKQELYYDIVVAVEQQKLTF